jgi:hypothetical protein
MASKFYFSKQDLVNPNLELPSIEKLASIFRDRKFNLEILPFKQNESRKFKAKCNLCTYTKISTWPFNTTNLNTHFKNKHFIYLEPNIEDASSASNIEETSSFNTLNNYFSNSSSTTTNKLIRKRPSFMFFNKEEYKTYLLKFIIGNNLPFSIVDSSSF